MKTLLTLAFTLIAMLSLLLYTTEEAMNSERAKNAELNNIVYELEKDNEELRNEICELRSNDIVSEANSEYVVVAEVTAYTASDEECGKSDGITASGVRAIEGITIAADDLPFGTEVTIQGRNYVVQDRFDGGYHNRIDIFMEDSEAAMEFGRKKMEVKIRRCE